MLAIALDRLQHLLHAANGRLGELAAALSGGGGLARRLGRLARRSGDHLDGGGHFLDQGGTPLHHLRLGFRPLTDLFDGFGDFVGRGAHLLGGRREPLGGVGNLDRGGADGADQGAQAVDDPIEGSGKIACFVGKGGLRQMGRRAQITVDQGFGGGVDDPDIGGEAARKEPAEEQPDEDGAGDGEKLAPLLGNPQLGDEQVEADDGGDHHDEPDDEFVTDLYTHRSTPCGNDAE